MKGIEDVIHPFVTKNSGLESGYMITHVTAAALASENKTLAHPASVDSLPTSGGQEDLVSMAPWAGRKLLKIQQNLRMILAIELMVSGAANHTAFPDLKPGKGTKPVLDLLNTICKFEYGDRVYSGEMESLASIIQLGGFLQTVNERISVD